MAIERRVKPSARAREQLAQRRRPLIIVGIALFLVVCIGGIGFFVFQQLNKPDTPAPNPLDNMSDYEDQTGTGLGPSVSAEKALLAGGTDYKGNWAEDAGGRYSIYLPGTEVQDLEGYTSKFVTKNEGDTAAYGVMVGTEAFPTLNNDPTGDTSAVLSAFVKDIAVDISKAMYDASFSGAYDMSSYDLADGSKAIWIGGDMQSRLSFKNENGVESPPEDLFFPICGFIAMRDDTPIFVWGVANPKDNATCTRLASDMQQCAEVFASTKNIDDFNPIPNIDATTGVGDSAVTDIPVVG